MLSDGGLAREIPSSDSYHRGEYLRRADEEEQHVNEEDSDDLVVRFVCR